MFQVLDKIWSCSQFGSVGPEINPSHLVSISLLVAILMVLKFVNENNFIDIITINNAEYNNTE